MYRYAHTGEYCKPTFICMKYLFLVANQFLNIISILLKIFLDTVLTRHNQSRPQKLTPGLLYVWSGFVSALGLLGVCYGLTWGQLLGSTHWSEKQTHNFFLQPVRSPLVYSKYTGRDIWSFFRVCFWNRGSSLYVCSGSVWGLLGVSSGSAIADLKQTQEADSGLVEVYFLLGWVWLVL